MTAETIRAALGRIQGQRRIVDAPLRGPSRWRGPLRRELMGRPDPEGFRARVARVFDGLAQRVWQGAALPKLNLEALTRIHAEVANPPHGLRTRNVRVGRNKLLPATHLLQELTEEALRRAQDGHEPVPLAAQRLHFELLLIHPFRDGNGRAARLAASYLLLGAGYKSTLLTAVEQHFQHDPPSYGQSFIAFDETLDYDAWMDQALNAMAQNSAEAAWFLRRERDLAGALEGLGVPRSDHDRVLAEFDLGRLEGMVARGLSAHHESWHRVKTGLPPDVQQRLRTQLWRHREERRDDASMA